MTTTLPDLQVAGPLYEVPTDAQLDAAARQMGIALPPSYREFARRYGHGLTGGLFVIFVPIEKDGFDWTSDLVSRSKGMKEEIATAIAEGFIEYDPSGSPELAGRLVPFGGSENGDILAWDPQDPSSDDGELWIYIVGSRMDSVWKSAPDLADFLTRMTQPMTGQVLERAKFALRPTFKGRPGRGKD